MLLNPISENQIHGDLRGQRPPARDHLPPIPRRIYLIFGIIGLMLTGLVGYGFYTGYRISASYAPLIDAAMEIKIETTNAYLSLSGVLHNDIDQDYHGVLKHVEEAMWYLRAMLQGGHNFEGTFTPIPDDDLLHRVEEAQNDFIHLKSSILQRLKRSALHSLDVEMDQDNNARYRNFIQTMDDIETSLQRLMSQSQKRFGAIQGILIVAFSLFVTYTVISFRRSERHQMDTYDQLRRSFMRLEREVILRKQAEDKVLKAYDGLETKVQQRTQDLNAANQKLCREIRERRKAEKNLIQYQARLRALTSELSLSEARERRRIAQELHDGIGQNLSAISLSKLTQLRQLDGGAFDAALEDIYVLIKRMIEDTRQLIVRLAPSTLYELGLVAAVEELIDKIKSQHHLRVAFQGDGTVRVEDEGMRAFLFQSVCELLANIAAHAQAQSAAVCIRRQEGNIRIEISDDGRGFVLDEQPPDDSPDKRLDIFKIQERLRHFGGTLEIDSKPGSGTRAVLLAPLQ